MKQLCHTVLNSGLMAVAASVWVCDRNTAHCLLWTESISSPSSILYYYMSLTHIIKSWPWDFSWKTTNIVWFQLPGCEEFVIFWILYDCKLNMFGFWYGQTNQKHLKTLSRALGNCDGHFSLFSSKNDAKKKATIIPKLQLCFLALVCFACWQRLGFIAII